MLVRRSIVFYGGSGIQICPSSVLFAVVVVCRCSVVCAAASSDIALRADSIAGRAVVVVVVTTAVASVTAV
jgi:hypothetical protein